ncbi:MAG: PP2C family protein-serine/threonine phosphatase [Vicinamibacteraceae bacterium]
MALHDGQRFSSTIYHAVVAGSCAAASAWTAMRRVRWLPFAVVFQLALIFPLRNLVNQAGAQSATELTLATRLMFDMVGSLVGVDLGYILFIVFFVRAGARLADVQAELRLARVIHQTLVPPIACRLGRFEFDGGWHSAGHVGGDLLDVIPVADHCWVAYVADVAGHGVPSALLTGMVKSAMRVRLMTPGSLSDVVADLNRIVCDHSAPNVFVTLRRCTACELCGARQERAEVDVEHRAWQHANPGGEHIIPQSHPGQAERIIQRPEREQW